MIKRTVMSVAAFIVLATVTINAEEWTQFRGPGGQGTSDQTGLPLKWSAKENVVWKTELPGPGTSSPITVGDSIYLTCYTGYGLEPGVGEQQNLMRHLICLDRKSGAIAWTKDFKPELPEHKYEGEGAYHGYSSSTIASDGERLYVFFGKSGVYCLDLKGNEVWHKSVGSETDRWGSANSPVLYNNLVIVNASIESKSIVALDKVDGHEVWKAEAIESSWNTPVVVNVPNGRTELVVSVRDKLMSFSPDNGQPYWSAEGVHRYVCPSVVDHDGVIYCIGGGHTGLAVRAGGSDDVTKSHVVWRKEKGSNVSSPVYHDGHVYWASEKQGIVYCQKAADGEFVYEKRLDPSSGLIYGSPLLADGKIYYVSQHDGTFVLPASPQFELLAHNVFEGDDNRMNASPVVDGNNMLLRNDKYIYCIGGK